MAAGPSADSELEPLCLAHLNIRGLRAKTSDIGKLLTKYKIHVLALTETRLDENFKNTKLRIQNFRLYRKDRNSGKGGGVGFYIHSFMTVIQRYDLDDNDLEMIWVEIYLPDTRPVLVGCCYRPPGSYIHYLKKLCRKIEMVSSEDKNIFLLGDFNIDWLKESAEKERIDFVSSVCGLTQIIDKPTRVNVTKLRSTSTCIDHIYTNILKLHSQPVIPLHKSVISVTKRVSDHKLITATVQRSVLGRRNTETVPLSELFKSLLVSEASEENIRENKHSLDFRRVEEGKVKRLLSLVNPYLLQTAGLSISAHICDILNWCIDRGKFLSQGHESCVCSPYLRPILEKVLLQQMEEHFNKLFTQRPTLDDITKQWITDLDKNKKVGVAFMDFSFSSDVISPDLLIPKLKSYGFKPLAISMMRSFLSHGNSSSCCWTDTYCDLPRGSCMTHFLFSVYSNDLKFTLKSADVVVSGSQLMIYYAADDYKGLKKMLRDESEIVRDWLRKNRMVLKTFTSARIKEFEPLNQIQIRLKSTLSVNVEEFNWIRVLRVLLHETPNWVWTS